MKGALGYMLTAFIGLGIGIGVAKTDVNRVQENLEKTISREALEYNVPSQRVRAFKGEGVDTVENKEVLQNYSFSDVVKIANLFDEKFAETTHALDLHYDIVQENRLGDNLELASVGFLKKLNSYGKDLYWSLELVEAGLNERLLKNYQLKSLEEFRYLVNDAVLFSNLEEAEIYLENKNNYNAYSFESPKDLANAISLDEFGISLEERLKYIKKNNFVDNSLKIANNRDISLDWIIDVANQTGQTVNKVIYNLQNFEYSDEEGFVTDKILNWENMYGHNQEEYVKAYCGVLNFDTIYFLKKFENEMAENPKLSPEFIANCVLNDMTAKQGLIAQSFNNKN